MSKQMPRSMALSEIAHRRIRKVQSMLYSNHEIDMHLSDILLYVMDEIGTEQIIASKIAEKFLKNGVIRSEHSEHAEKIVQHNNNMGIQLIKS